MKQKNHIILKICHKYIADILAQKTRHIVVVLLAMSFSYSNNILGQNSLVPFSFTLSSDAKTSAGVYKKDGTLVRTLWNGVSYPAGTHTRTWDRRDDDGRLVTDSNYTVKVLSNNVKYKWDGVIGNTSDSTRGSSVIRSYYRMQSMTVFNDHAYFGTGYNEAAGSCFKFNTNKPQNKSNILYGRYETNQATTYVATDGNYVYWAGNDPFGGSSKSTSQSVFTYATRVSDDGEVLFQYGNPVQCGWGRQYNKAIDVILNNTPLADVSGMAVQKNGKYLFVAHGALNIINVLDKKTGQAITSISSFTNPRELCIDGDDNLWVISSTNTVEKYTVDSTNGTLSSVILAITDILEPITLTVTPNNYQVVILDGDTSQQIKSFSNISGVPLWVYGKAGGYENDPTVTTDKFYFTDHVDMKKQFIAFQPDSSFWVSDGGNERVLHYSNALTYIDQIMYMPATYSVQAVRNDPTRVFNQLLEFQIDYSKPLSPNNGSWTLVKNWRHAVPDYYLKDIGNMLDNIITYSNGRTYATINNAKNPYVHYPEVVELPASGNIRFTGIKFDAFALDIIDLDGSRRSYVPANGTTADSGYWVTRALTGYSNNNPVWGNPVKVGTINCITPKDPSYDPYYGHTSLPAKTSSDILVQFNTLLSDGYHLGGIKQGDNKYLWKTSPATYKESSYGAADDYQGEFPTDGSYDIGNNVQYGGGHVYTIEKNIFWNYHGEFWKGSQTNMWNHVYDNGLLVSAFGITLPEGKSIDWEACEAGAGNVFSSVFVKVGSDYYLYHNDESVHSGLHRWKITGLNTIQEQTANISFSLVKGGLVGAYFDGTDLNNFNRKVAMVDPTVNLTTAPSQLASATNFSARWTGFVKPAYSQNYTFFTAVNKGVKLWIDGNLVINQWKNTAGVEFSSASIKLESGKKYKVRMEINGGTAALSWSSTSQAKQIIPSANLYPSDIPSYANDGVDLMEGLNFRSILEDGMYGWNRNSAQEDNTSGTQYWRVKTNVKACEKESPDVLIKFRSNNGSNNVTRDLGPSIPCLESWTLSGQISFDGNYANHDNTNFGGFFDVLDDKGKIISRITNELTYDGNIMPTQVKCNGVAIVNEPAGKLQPILNRIQPFSINVDSNGVTFLYADYNSIKANIYDAASNWKKPTSVRFHFTGNPSYPNYDKAIDVVRLRFLGVAPSVPQISVSGPTVFCQGDSVTLTSSTSNAYQWSNSATTQSISVKTPGSYSVIVKDSKGCPLPSAKTNVVVNTLPVAIITASKATTFCQGDSITLTANTAGSYQWSTTQTSQKINVSSAGLYTLLVKDNIGCSSVVSPPVSVTVNPLPLIPTITADKLTSFCMGDTVRLTSSPANAYLWSNNATTQTIAVTNTGDYLVNASDINGCSSRSTTTPVKVNIIPATVITASGPTTFCSGETVTLTASPAVSYLWSNNEITQSIVVDVTGDMAVITKDANTCYSASPVTKVTVNDIPATPVISPNGFALTSSSATGNQWLLNGNSVPGANKQTYTPVQNGDYTVEVSDGNGCAAVSDPFIYNMVNIHDIKSDKQIIIIPNPNNGRFMIKSDKIKEGSISIFNMLGEIIPYSGRIDEEIDLSAIAKGMYRLEITINDEIFREILILQ